MSKGKMPIKRSLLDTDIVTRPALNRRTFVAAAIVGAAALATTKARAQGVSDSDGGVTADPAGQGRGTSAGVSDTDTGASADPVGQGRGPQHGFSGGSMVRPAPAPDPVILQGVVTDRP